MGQKKEIVFIPSKAEINKEDFDICEEPFHYKHHKMEVGINWDKKILIIFADDYWLTGIKIGYIYPITKKAEAKKKRLHLEASMALRTALSIIDTADKAIGDG